LCTFLSIIRDVLECFDSILGAGSNTRHQHHNYTICRNTKLKLWKQKRWLNGTLFGLWYITQLDL